jgi:hypothetical protein
VKSDVGPRTQTQLTSGWTATATNNDWSQGGKVTLTPDAVADNPSGTLVIIRATPQNTELAGSVLGAEAVINQFDDLQRQIQELQEQLNRALLHQETDSADQVLPDQEGRKSQFFGWDAEGAPVASFPADLAQDVVVTAFAETLLDDATAAAARTTLDALGTTEQAADSDTVDGEHASAFADAVHTHVSDPSFKGHLHGLKLSNNAVDATNDIDIAVGTCVDEDGTYFMELSSAFTKRLDAAWAAGTGNGGLFSGSVAADTTYHVFVIRKDSDGSIDVGFDTDADAANIPSGYTAYRRIGSILTTTGPAIRAFTQHGDRFVLNAFIDDVSAGSIALTPESSNALTVPDGIEVIALFSFKARQGALEADHVTLGGYAGVRPFVYRTSTSGSSVSNQMQIPTVNATLYRQASSTAASNVRVQTAGWIDIRGRS